ncbi:MAG TPA: serine O-acetyltransferase [Chloroflexota bacterium]|jgi:serine O-acetyltransferase|nr:serine O-acetyltransferase [Chloroflexota bacterium]
MLENLGRRLRALRRTVAEDVAAVMQRDPAARSAVEVVTCYPGVHALWIHRLAHPLYERRLYLAARMVSHLGRALTGVEIHPGARIGRRVVIDHGMGVVIGETAEVGDDVLLYQGVTLGGVSLNQDKRHPTIGNRVVIGAGAKVMGPIVVGDDARVGAGSVVTRPVESGATVVGVPAHPVHIKRPAPIPMPNLEHADLPDPVIDAIRVLVERVERLEAELHLLRGHQHTHEHGEANGRSFEDALRELVRDANAG